MIMVSKLLKPNHHLKVKRKQRSVLASAERGFLVGKVVASTKVSVGGRQNVEVVVKGGRTVDALLTGRVEVEKGTAVLLRRTVRATKNLYRIVELLSDDAEDKTLSPKTALLALSKRPPDQHLEVRLDARGLKDPVDVLVPTGQLAELIKSDVTSDRPSSDPMGLDTSLWGAAPTNGDVRAAEGSIEAELMRQRESVINASLSRTQAADRLRITPQSVSDWISRGDLLGFKDGREWRIPAWQFDPKADLGLKVGLKELSLAFGGSVVGLSLWATTPNEDFGGKAPADVLRAATLSRVVSSARAVGHVW